MLYTQPTKQHQQKISTYSIMATVEVELQNEDKSASDKKTIFRYWRLYDTFVFIAILLLFINYFTVICFKQEKVFLGSDLMKTHHRPKIDLRAKKYAVGATNMYYLS